MNTFRKIICGLAAAALSSSASAQSLMQGQIVVSGLDMARTEETSSSPCSSTCRTST